MKGRYIQDVVNEPGFERIRSEILANIEFRAREAQEAFKGLLTFCGIIYSGGTIAILSSIGARSATGVSYFSLAAFGLFVLALLSFAYYYQRHSWLMQVRHHDYVLTAHKFFTRQMTLEDMIAAGMLGQDAQLYRRLFWVPVTLVTIGFILGGLGALGIGPTIHL